MSCLGQPREFIRFAGHSVTLGDCSSPGAAWLTAFLRLNGYGHGGPPLGDHPRYLSAGISRHHDAATSPATRAGCPRGTHQGGEAPGVDEHQGDSTDRGKQAQARRGKIKNGRSPLGRG
jgi:hypothetical protein